MKRKCKDCPKETQAVCRHAFGVYWCIKSADGKGCNHPVDGVAAAWKKAGWTPDGKVLETITLSVPVTAKQGEFEAVKPLSDDDY